MAAVILLAAAAAPTDGVTAEQAMSNYRAMLQGATDTTRGDCPDTRSSAIVVCGRQTQPPPRLPLPDERAEAGEVVRHLGEPPKGDPGAPTGPPSRQKQTVKALFGLLKGAVTGEDAGP